MFLSLYGMLERSRRYFGELQDGSIGGGKLIRHGADVGLGFV